jgi:hypothetical protein
MTPKHENSKQFPREALAMAIMAALAAIFIHPTPTHAEGTIAAAQGTDILNPTAGPCDQRGTDAGYVGGVDADGNPVEPADAGGGNVHVTLTNEQVQPVVRLHQPKLAPVQVSANVDGLNNALNPPPACPAVKTASKR